MLEKQHQLVVVLRLVVDDVGRLSHGEAVDANGASIGRFSDWRRISPIVRTWVQRQAGDGWPSTHDL
jgi:hypothetical protein